MVTTWPKYTTRNQIIVHHDTAHTSYSTTSFVHGKSLHNGVYRSLRLLLPILLHLLFSFCTMGKLVIYSPNCFFLQEIIQAIVVSSSF